MAQSAVVLRAPRVLADVVPAVRLRDALLVLAGACLTIIGAQVSIAVPPSPVPITGQTLAVIVAGSALGARRGALSQLLYVALGLFLPVYADGGSGLDVVWGASGGYLVGFVLAAYVVGTLAARGADRLPSTAFATFVLGQLIIFGCGVPWLKVATDMNWSTAVHDGFVVFIVGGLVKALIAAGTVPLAWRGVRRVDRAEDARPS